MTETPCPECMGRCCRNDYGYPLAHLNWDVGEHWCEHCFDGTVPVDVHVTCKTRIAELEACLRWYVEEDDTRTGLPSNQYWTEGKQRAMRALGMEEDG